MADMKYERALALAKKGSFDEAEGLCSALLKDNPADYSTRYLLSSIKFLTNRFDECREECIKLLEISTTNADVFNMMAAISTDYDVDFIAAEQWLQRALACDPKHIKAITNLAGLQLRKQDKHKAEELYLKAMKLSGGKDAGALIGLGTIKGMKESLNEAIDLYRKALKFDPNNRQALSSLITTLYSSGNLDEALEISLSVVSSSHLGQTAIPIFACLKSFCQWDAADAILPVMLDVLDDKIRDRNLLMQPNLPLLSTYEVTNEQLLQAHRGVGKSIVLNRLKPPFIDHPKAFAPSNKIRLAYLSPDLKSHVVSHFFRGLVNHCDRERYELHLYSNLPAEYEDDVTKSYREHVDYFVSVWDMTDIELAERIRNDGIHILIEMSGYTANNRVSALAYRPAPVQISYLGYPCTLGLDEFDYHISDPWLDGPENAQYFVEKPLRMPQSFLTFGEFYEQVIDPVAPFVRNGFITFGSLSNAYKLNPKTLELWSSILHRVPNSRLYLCHGNYKTEAVQKSVYREFAKYGIPSEHVSFVTEKHPSRNHLRYYNEIDIALDSMPLTGGTTTIDALWMGVPVITKVGDAHAQRMSYSIINNTSTELADCIAFSEEEYVECAVRLAENLNRLEALRKHIPEAMRSSILRDPRNFTSQFENVLVDAWNQKFSELPIESLLTGQIFKEISIEGVPMIVQDTLKDMHTYVLREQGRWLEPESAFLTRIASHFNHFFDFAADPGVFAIPIAAAQAESGGSTFAIRNPGIFSILLSRSIELNVMKNIEVGMAAPRGGLMPDLVRISLDWINGSEGDIKQIMPMLEAASPLILASLRNPLTEDHSAKNLLESCGYQPYRLLPGYDLLVPIEQGVALEPSDINLFFCRPQRAEELEKLRVLCRVSEEIDVMPSADLALWAPRLEKCPYAAPYMQKWLQSQPVGELGATLRLILNLDVEARDQSFSPAQRYARVQMIDTVVPLLLQTEPTVPRLLTAIKLMVDCGKRASAVAWAGVLQNGLDGQSGVVFDEPFLAPLPIWEQVPVKEDEVDWAHTAARVSIERLRSFSSWYTSAESLEFWKSLRKNTLIAEEAERMTALIKQRIVVGVRFGMFVDDDDENSEHIYPASDL